MNTARGQLFSFASMFGSGRNSFAIVQTSVRRQAELKLLLEERDLRCAVSNDPIKVTSWVAIVPDLHGRGLAGFVLEEAVKERPTLQPCSKLVLATLEGEPIEDNVPIPLPPSPRSW